MEVDCSKLILIFIGDKAKSIFSGYKVLDKIYDFETSEIMIPNKLFEPLKEKKLLEFQLIIKEDSKMEGESPFPPYHFYTYFGINKAYCFIEHIGRVTFDICCLDEKIKISNRGINLDEFNYLENDTRARIILINAPITVSINERKDLYSFIPFSMDNTISSVQIAFFDSSEKDYSIKAISKDEINDEISIIKVLRENKEVLNKFPDDLEAALIKGKPQDDEIYKNLIGPIDLDRIENNFSKRKDVLKKAFDDEELYDLYYKYILWYFCDLKFFPRNEKEEDCSYKISILYKYIKEFYEKYKNDKDLLTYQRILLFHSNAIFFLTLNDEEKYKNSELQYINIKNFKEQKDKEQKGGVQKDKEQIDKEQEGNSVFNLSFQFIDNFIEQLNSKSALFYPLLLLDGGLYYHGDDSLYGFDFQSCEIIKKHLKELVPDVFFIYKYESLNKEKGFNFKGLSTIFINKLTVLDNYEGDPQSKDSNIKVVKHYAMKTSKVIMHECFGHNKLLYGQSNAIDSPRNFFNKEKKLITMIPKSEKNLYDINENYFFINKEKYVGEGGNFFEYFFGIYEDDMVIDLIHEISDVGKLIDNIKYFVSENLDVLRKYIICHYILQKNKIKYALNENNSLEQDINEMEIILKKNNLSIVEKTPPKEQKKIIKKRKDEKSDLAFVLVKEEEIKNYSYYLKKMREAKNRDEARRYARELIYHHLKKE